MTAAIEVDQVSRVFGDGKNRVKALSDVSFQVPAGSVTAMLGVNGAGKTTLTKILSTLLLPSSGTARILGLDVVRDARRVRQTMSVIFGGDRGLYGQLSGADNLRYFAVLNGLERRGLRQRIAQALDEVGLGPAAHRLVQTYSKGMRQRLHLAIGLISQPKVLLLDEPTVGLDPLEAQRLRDVIGELRDRGVGVLLTSHHLLDVERLADQVVLLDKGRVRLDVPLAQFVAHAGYAATVVVSGRGPEPDEERLAVFGTTAALGRNAKGWEIRLRVKEWSPSVLANISQALAAAEVTNVRVESARLEDAYAELARSA